MCVWGVSLGSICLGTFFRELQHGSFSRMSWELESGGNLLAEAGATNGELRETTVGSLGNRRAPAGGTHGAGPRVNLQVNI